MSRSCSGHCREHDDGIRAGRRSVILADLANRELASLTRGELTARIRALAEKSPTAGNRKLAHVKAFLNWCVNEDFIETNVVDKVKRPGREVPRTRCHSLGELAEIWAAAGKLGYPFGPMIQLLMVIPMRRDEIASLPIEELRIEWAADTAEGKWTIPGERVKNGRALNVPLSALSVRIIRATVNDPARPQDSCFLFTTTGITSVSGFRKAKARLDRYIEEAREAEAVKSGRTATAMPHWTVHDLRTSFATQAAELLHIDIAVVDRMLNHVATATTSPLNFPGRCGKNPRRWCSRRQRSRSGSGEGLPHRPIHLISIVASFR